MIDQQQKNAKRTRVFFSYARGDEEVLLKRLHAGPNDEYFFENLTHHLVNGHILWRSDDNNQRNLSLRLTLKLQPENTIP